MTKPSGEKILIVEDDPFTRDLLKEELQELGYSTSFAVEGKEAVQKSRGLNPDLILLDVMMPELDGFEVCKALRKEPKTANTPIIFITARDTSQDIVRGLGLGANDYVAKPIVIEVLAARMETQLRTKRLLDQVRLQKTELEKLNTTIKELLGMAAHDLRTPVTVIKLIASNLLEVSPKPGDEGQKTLLQKVYHQTSYMNQLIDDVLGIASIETGKIALNILPEDLNRLLGDTIASLSWLARNKAITMTFDADSSLPPVPLDKARFTQIIDNVVSNAIKFTPEGGTIRVKTGRCSVKNDGKWALISVADTGQGIGPEDINRLFQPFAPGVSKPTKGEKSTGLGLTIAKRLTELHQGKLEVNSELEKGTEFIIKLPLP